LVAHDVPYSSAAYTEKTLYPPDGKFLYYAGNEKMPAFAAKAVPAPRGHRAVGTGLTGHVYFAAIAASAEALGVRVRRHERAARLVVDHTGRVIGVQTARLPDAYRPQHAALYAKVVPMLPFKAKVFEGAAVAARALERRVEQTRLIRARRGVILSTGGFALNLVMLARYHPFFGRNYRALMRLGSLGCDGSGIELGQSAGGATDLMDSMYAARNMAPPNALLEGILVNLSGRRFINEEAYSGHLGDAIARQTEGRAWLILSGRSFRSAIMQSVASGSLFFKFYGIPAMLNFVLGGSKRGPSPRALARRCGIDVEGLEQEVAQTDAALTASCEDKFGKSALNRKELGGGPLYAVDMSIPNIFAFTYLFTLGGLKVDEDSGAVLRADGSHVPGLYAAGRAAVGLCSKGYLSGMSIGDGVFSGRRAGRSAASPTNAT
jgi:3-oxo-5alpha-steroid 4-dehydrogenase